MVLVIGGYRSGESAKGAPYLCAKRAACVPREGLRAARKRHSFALF
jgi:hypothetical protein